MTLPVNIPSIDLSNRDVWTGRVLSTLAVLFLLADAIGKLVRPQAVIDGMTKVGWPADVILPLGILQLFCVLVYLVPRTSVFGAILLTGYLGGAVATHVRIGDPLFSHVLFPTYVALFLWLGLWFRNARLRAVVPITR